MTGPDHLTGLDLMNVTGVLLGTLAVIWWLYLSSRAPEDREPGGDDSRR